MKIKNINIEKSRYNPTKKALIFWCLFIGIGAVAGAIGMFVDTTGKAMGMDKMLPYFQKLPFAEYVFKDFLFSGFALLIVNGITNLFSAFLLFKNKKSGIITGMVWGITLMLWICIQFYMFPANFMDIAYFIFGLVQFLTGFACLTFYEQENFEFSENDYKNIGADKSTLVLYFSRIGYTQKVAFETADKLGADIKRVTTSELTKGTLGFWWCGRFGMHGWDMPIDELEVDVTTYKRIVICSPIWVFAPCGAVKGLCKALSGKIKDVSYVFVHFNPWLPKSAKNQLDEILGIQAKSVVSVTCQQGHIKIKGEI